MNSRSLRSMVHPEIVRRTLVVLLLGVVSLDVLLHSRLLPTLFLTDSSARKTLYSVHPWLLWSNVAADIVIAFSYGLFFWGLWWLIAKLRSIHKLLEYRWFLNAIKLFILTSFAMYLTHIVTVWWPIYRVAIALKVICALASIPSAVFFAMRAPAIAANVLRFFELVNANQYNSEELRQSQELLSITLKSIGDGVITTDELGNVAWLNPSAERMTGWSNFDAKGLPLTQIFHVLDATTRAETENSAITCLAQGEVAWLAANAVLISRDGNEFGIEDSAAPIRGLEGELLGVILVFHDVTEQRRLLTENNRVMKNSLKLKDDFLSHVSHELRSPLASIYSFSSIIADGLAGSTTSDQDEYIGIVLKNATQLEAMIEDLLTVTQAREGKLAIELQGVSTSDAISDAIHTTTGAASHKRIALSWHNFSPSVQAWADPTRLRQVLIVLLDNAVKFTPTGGTITVQVSETERSQLQFQVTDTGCGVPTEKTSRIFEHLYQIEDPNCDVTSHDGRNGLGLGLHIAQELVTRQGGEIWVTSVPGEGSTFHFTVPVACKELATASEDEVYVAA